MVEPRALDGMRWDDRQQLKEAVCDAVLERTRRVVSGEGVHGAAILGEKPSRVLSSGFILPRLNEDGDDESSDIKIPAHGMDLRVRPCGGVLRVLPNLAVYVRALPTAAELFAREGRLIPRADFNDAARQHAKDQINRRAAAEIPRGTPSGERAVRRAAISREIYIAMGVGVPPAARLPGGDERDDTAIEEGMPPSKVLSGRLRIPDGLSRRYDIPQKWIRLRVDAPALTFPLPCDPEEWQRLTAGYKTQLLTSIRAAYLDWIASPVGQSEAWRKLHPPSEAFWDPESWDRFLATARAATPSTSDLVPNFDVQILVQPLRDPLEQGSFSVRIALENLREGDSAMECGLFNASLTVELPNDALGPMRLERVRRSYHLAGFMTMPAIGVNGGVSDLGMHEGARSLRTTWMPRYVLPRAQATEVAAVPTSYGQLGLETTELSDLAALPQALRDWIDLVARETQLSVAGEEGTAEDEAAQQTRFQDDLQSWRNEAARISAGVALLAEAQEAWRHDRNAAAGVPYRAWLLLNRTFAAASPPREGEPPPGWRLFQLAFVLAHVPTFASRLPEYAGHFNAVFDEDAASLLYMATGGGKTEAFFGTLVFALFLDRMRGKHRGVTAMMHYPLRLLTVQQAQRLARLLARAEMVRRAEHIDGSAFEIGFWVGGTNTPNSTEKRPGEIADALRCVPVSTDARARDEDALMASQERIDREYVAAKTAWNKLPVCPFCGSDRGTGLRLFPERHHQLGIVCLHGSCDWNRSHRTDGLEPLPFLIADTDIYRRAPAVLLGTIDKLALLGQSTTTVDRIAGMFGLARWIENAGGGLLHMPSGTATSAAPPPGHQRVAPAYPDGVEVFFDPFPSLIVQDEMHLLEESLGTFGGIFETGLFAWLSRLSQLLGQRVCRVPGAPDRPRLPHVIGATATAADAAKHTRALYQRRVIQFPHPGPSLHGGFYTRIASFQPGGAAATERQAALGTPRGREAAAPWGRVYASLMTNGRLHTVTTLSVLAAHAATVTRWERDLASSDAARQARAATEIEECVSDARWFDTRRAAVRTAAREGRFDRLAALVDLHRIELTYVTNKKGGDQILSALETEVREAHAAMGPEYALSSFTMELISGGVDIGGIQSVIRAAERPFDPMHDDIGTALRGIVATSAISHGVDVESFNAMAFAGMPSDIAEYIQASSRVGRTHVGFSLLIPTPQTRRDRFVVEVHESFHRLLERMIAPPAVERWADRAISRTIPSLVQMWLAGVRHQERFLAAALEHKAQITLPTTVEQVERLLRDARAFDDCVAFVVEAVGIGATTGAPTNPIYYSDLVRAAAARIQAVIASGDFTGRLNDFWSNPLSGLQRPMTSLRDVDAAGRIRASQRTQRNQPLSWEEVGEAMAMVRNRGVSRGRRTASSELDGEA
ncbi:DEAD/DEAH box helicase family protein [Nitrospirillum viridazoti]|uniref:Helicase n=1 Tax=Nitrospirillum viridazoti CBAmc TaxID=1441467 RepID=A0A248JQ81_9PROT|nr:DEAD/DEAH box helicase family protein [Nitrospirillum amazonense]ASG20238.1 helicase [Nitrospirillum amazonense CBAmc]TWB26705.1 helicase-like protein [Nitrospirillum amazonense]